MSKPELMTVFSDASFSDNKAGWGAWAKYKGETLRMSSGITFPVDNISDAETIALVSAILRAIKHWEIPNGTVIVAQSDSTDALAALIFTGWSNGQNQYFRVAKNTDVYPRMPRRLNAIRKAFGQKVFDVVQERNITVYLKHVRAHTKKDDARSWVNEWCDGMAKKEMRSVVHQSSAFSPSGGQGERV